MSIMQPDRSLESVTFTDLSRNPKAVADKTTSLGSVRVTHRDAPDFVLTTAVVAEQRDESLTTASRLFMALMKQNEGMRTLVMALPDVFPWVRHLDEEEVREFALELFGALSDAAELDAASAVQRTVISWRATARIYADPEQRKDAEQPLSGIDLGPVEVAG